MVSKSDNNHCEFTAIEHKFKSWFCTQKQVLNVRFKDFWYTKINLSQNIYCNPLLYNNAIKKKFSDKKYSVLYTHNCLSSFSLSLIFLKGKNKKKRSVQKVADCDSYHIFLELYSMKIKLTHRR